MYNIIYVLMYILYKLYTRLKINYKVKNLIWSMKVLRDLYT